MENEETKDQFESNPDGGLKIKRKYKDSAFCMTYGIPETAAELVSDLLAVQYLSGQHIQELFKREGTGREAIRWGAGPFTGTGVLRGQYYRYKEENIQAIRCFLFGCAPD